MNNLGRGNENKHSDKDRILTRETVGMVVILFAALALLILITRSLIFGSVGFAISSFLLGTFGYCSYAVLAALFYLGFVLITGKKITATKKMVALCVLFFALLVCLVHTITAAVGEIAYGSYGGYLSSCYKAGENSFFQTTGGGVIFGLVVYPVVKVTTSVGGYIIFSLLMAGCAYFIYATKSGNSVFSSSKSSKTQKRREIPVQTPVETATRNTSDLYDLNYAEPEYEQAQPAPVAPDYPNGQAAAVNEPRIYRETPVERSKRLYAVGDQFDFKSKRELNKENKRAEAQRREQQKNMDQPASAYAQSHSILYPNNDQPASANYTNNLIFDANSYFNNPNRGTVTREQYSNNFKDVPSFSEGHERSARTDNPATAAPMTSYTNLYSDGEDGNITYSNKPKKIVTDTTRNTDTAKPDTPYSTFTTPSKDFYRNDVTNQSGSAAPARTEETEQPYSSYVSRRGNIAPKIETPETPAENSVSTDFGSRRSDVSASNFGEENVGIEDFNVSETPKEEPPVRRDRFTKNIVPSVSKQEIVRQDDVPVIPEEPVRFQRPASDFESNAQSEAPRQEQEELFESAADLFDSEDIDDDESLDSVIPTALEESTRLRQEREKTLPALGRSRELSTENLRGQEAQAEKKPKHIYQKYMNPPLSLLRDYAPASENSEEEVNENILTIKETLAQLKISCEIMSVTQGPMVTRYDIDIPGNIPASKVLGCDTELAMRLHARDGVNIQPNYENGSISIEVPNKQKTTVGLKEIISADEFINAKSSSLMFGMGKNIEGKAISGDIVKMKHLLVAGSTGSGKSVCLNSLIISLLYKYSPEDLRIILVDPKQVEFNIYDKLPHLMINEIIYEPAKVISVLNWAITEMERRYTLFKEKTRKGTLVRQVDEYNDHLEPDEERLPKIVLIVDELADLMLVAKKDIEDRIQRLTQKSRAAGIHLVLATQRPSTDVITGIIKSNLPTRVAFKVIQEVDSRTILDSSGAEKLLGYGDMLYKTDTMTMPSRVQCAYLSSQEVQDVVEYIKEHNEAYYDDSVATYINNSERGDSFGGDGGDDSVEGVYIEALRYVVSIGQASISMIQRKCSVGYPKAGKIVEWMENMGYISAFDGAKSRKVLLTQEEFDAKYGDFGN